MIKRTHTCGEITINEANSEVILNGWIAKTRDLGSLIFIDLRDRYGKTQIVFNEKTNKDIFSKAKKLGLEDVIGIKGIVIKRPEDAINQNMVTGFVDVDVTDLMVYNESDPPPFDINNRDSASEEHRLRFRYLELRTKELQNNLLVRHKALLATRKYLSNQNFS
ncbi:uncharacterized protein METZ01_LOCUS356389, partial [marine metagenome]